MTGAEHGRQLLGQVDLGAVVGHAQLLEHLGAAHDRLDLLLRKAVAPEEAVAFDPVQRALGGALAGHQVQPNRPASDAGLVEQLLAPSSGSSLPSPDR